MNEASKTCGQLTLPDTPSVTFSRGSADGLTPFVLPDGRTISPSGLAAALASLSARQVRALGLRTSGISGRRGSTSSSSAALASSLESRLRAQLNGSVSCSVTWKPWITPWQRDQWKPRALARTISGIAIGLWPTMTSNAPARNGQNEAGNSAGQVAIRSILLGLWPTATATARDWKSPAASEATLARNARPLNEVVLALWSTLRASDGAKGGPSMSFGAGGSPLPSQVSTVASTSNAPTENGGRSLHPEFAGWVMGYPPEWLSYAPSETRSTRGRRAPSSARTSKLAEPTTA